MSFLAWPSFEAAIRLPAEIAFLIDAVPTSTLGQAAEAARRSNADAATALMNGGSISEEAYYRALARRLGVTFLDAFRLRDDVRSLDVTLRHSVALLEDGGLQPLVAAPRGRAIAALLDGADAGGPLPAITTPTRLREAAFARHGTAIAAAASESLGERHPEWSCRPGARPLDLALVGAIVGLVVALAHLPTGPGLLLLALLQTATLIMLTLRLACAFMPPEAGAKPSLPDDRLPTYTVIVALYREARVARRLFDGLASLDYPASKLQILFLLEEDDAETLAAFRAIDMPARFEIVVVPDGKPRTKPRALNVALELARGDLLVVYDAEDVVDPMQLRLAAEAFAQGHPRLAAVQGHLVIDNHDDGLLPKFFAIEYASLFDVLGPALATWRMPTPLGGTSTHFKTRVLRELHGWDAWNVTEDADLGMRLALTGYHVGDLPSFTMEEAPSAPRAWLKQRTRWMKGFLQTSFTHTRRPLDTLRLLGPMDTLWALTLVPGTVLSALLYPFLTLLAAYQFAFGPSIAELGGLGILTTGASFVVLFAGLAAMLLPGVVGCIRRDWWDLLWLVPFLPAYYLLVSAAAWLAVFELARHPHRWNKTEHGLSRTSRSGALRAGATVLRPSPAAAVPS